MSREPEKKVRITIDLTKGAHTRLRQLRAKTTFTTIAALVRRAVVVFEVLVEARARGDEVVIRSKDGKTTQVLL